MPDANADNGPPSNTLSERIPLANKYLQDGSVPIFWGDNQFLNEGTLEYSHPSGMVDQSTLHIPKVVRFLYTYSEGDNTEHGELGDDEVVVWTIVSYGDLGAIWQSDTGAATECDGQHAPEFNIGDTVSLPVGASPCGG